MGLLLDSNLIPINMCIYLKNQSEKPKLKEVVSELKQEVSYAGKTIRVADKGLNCAANILDALNSGDGYIFSKTIKGQSQTERIWALRDDGFEDHINMHTGEVIGRIKSVVDTFTYKVTGTKKTFTVKEKRVVTLNFALRRKQLQEIQKMVDRASRLCLCKAKKSEFGECASFVEFTAKNSEDGEIAVRLNQKAIDKAKECAGYNMIVTSETHLSVNEIYHTYHQLWRIEETFRSLKSFLDARPVYVQKENSIKGHFLVCYLSIVLTRILQFYHLQSRFGTQQVFDFLRGFKVLEVSPRVHMNLATRTPVGDYIAAHTKLMVDKAIFNGKELNRIIEMKKRDLPRVKK